MKIINAIGTYFKKFPGGFQFGTSGSLITVTGNVELQAADAPGFEHTLPPQSGLITLGSGSIGSIPKFVTEYQIDDSIISESGTVITISGDGFFTGDITGSNFTGSFFGDGTGLTGVTSYTDADTLDFINSISVVSGSIEYNENLDVDLSSPEVVALIPTSSYDGVFFDYIIKSGSNARAGMIMSTYINETVTYTDNSTIDIGDTTSITLSVDILSGNIRLMATTTTDNWIVKTLIRKI